MLNKIRRQRPHKTGERAKILIEQLAHSRIFRPQSASIGPMDRVWEEVAVGA